MTTDRSLLVLMLIGSLVGPTRAQEPEVLHPNLERFEPMVRRQLGELRRDVTESTDPESYGLLGETYLAYELPEEAGSALAVAARLDPAEPRWPYLRALAALGLGDREVAVRHFESVLALRSEHLPTLLRCAEILLDLGRTEDASARFAEVRRVLGEQSLPGVRAALHYGLGRLQAEAGRHDRAVAEFRRALDFQPGADGVYYHLARSLHRDGDPASARKALTRRGDLLPTFRDPWSATMKRRSDGSQADLQRGLKALKAGRLDAAEAALTRVAEQRPGDAEALAGLGRVYQLRQAPEEAEAWYRRALMAEPRTVTVLLNLGALLAQRGDDEASVMFRRATEADPGSAAGYYNLGLELLRRGDPETAERALRRALEIAPDDPAALEALARSLASRGDFAMAAEPYRRLVMVSPERADARFGFGLALTLGGRCGAARPVLDEAVERFALDGANADPEGAALAGLLARVLATCPDDSARDGGRALELAEGLFRRRPGVETARTLAMALAESGRHAQAAEQIRRTIEVAEQAGATALLPVLQRELEIYLAGDSVRSPWK